MKKNVNLKEYIHPKMELLFVALNAPENSNNNGHWFSNNLSFWNLLYHSGIITKPITNKLDGDVKVFGNNAINYKNWTIGVTDLNRRDVETNSNNVEVKPSDVKRILDIIQLKKVSKMCLMHSSVGKAFRTYATEVKFNNNRYGKIGTINQTEIYEVPFHNATVKNKNQYYEQLIKNTNSVNEVVGKVELPIENTTQKLENVNLPIQKNNISFIVDIPVILTPHSGHIDPPVDFGLKR